MLRKLPITCFGLCLFMLADDVWSSPVPERLSQQALELRDSALRDDTAYKFVTDLTTEVGARLAGTAKEARAREWAVRRLRRLGFDKKNIRVEPFEMRTWLRGDESAEVTAPFPQPLVVTALGHSGATETAGVEAEVVMFESIYELEKAAPDSLEGRIAYIGHAMAKTQDGSSYSFFGRTRWKAPSIAASKGAIAAMIRSIGTHSHRFAHTGGTTWKEGQEPIAAVALSPPDADQLERIARRGKPMRVRLRVTPRFLAARQASGNILVDIPGTSRRDEIVLVGGHLDSWDLGTGAVDDGAGVAITTAAVNLIRKSGLRPVRTIRLVLWGAEEVGLLGAKAYAEAHGSEKHVLGAESDFGAEAIYRVHANVSKEGEAVVDEIVRLLAPLGVAPGTIGSSYSGAGGPDLWPLYPKGLPHFRLDQDGSDYFDLHHTPNDTLDKISDRALRQNVACYAVMLWLAANTTADFAPKPRLGTVE